MASKQLLFRLFARLARNQPYERSHELLARVTLSWLSSPKWRLFMQRRLERVLNRPARPEEVGAALSELASVQADVEATLFLMDQRAFEESPRRVDASAAVKLIEQARSAGRGVILATPHYGNYALAILGLARAGVPLTVMFINSHAYEWLSEFGIKVAPFGSGAVDYFRALSANEAVVVFTDLDFFPEGRVAPLFGAPVRPPHAVARLAERLGAPVVPIYMERTADLRWRLEAESPLSGDVERGLLSSMEGRIARHPGRWALFLDIWDVEGTDRLNRRRMKLVAFFRSLLGYS